MDSITFPVQTLEDFSNREEERNRLLMESGATQDYDSQFDRHEGDADGNGDDDVQQIVSDAAIEAAMLDSVKRRRLLEGGPTGRSDAYWVEEPPKKTKAARSFWIPAIDKWHEDFNHIRLPTDPIHPTPTECFGCGYEDEETQACPVYAEKWNRLLLKFRECCANSSSPSVIARDLHDLFMRDFVVQLSMNSVENARSVARNWSPYKMLYHLFFHNRDTSIAASNKLAWIHEMQRTIVEQELYKEHAITGRRKVCKKGLKKFDMALKMELPWVKLRPDEMGFSVAKRRIDAPSITLLADRMKKTHTSTVTRTLNPWAMTR